MFFLDYVIFGVYMLAVLAIGVYHFLHNKSAEDYYVGSRSIKAHHVGLSIVATDVGGGFSIGLGGVGFAMGLSGSWLLFTGLVGAGRDNAADSSTGAELYVVIGHAPRHLDRNITSVGRVLSGIELLSALPRGPAPMGFFEDAAQHIAIHAIRLASELPESERTPIEVFRTDTPAFKNLVQARRERHETWFVNPVGHIELCNVPVPVRMAPAGASG